MRSHRRIASCVIVIVGEHHEATAVYGPFFDHLPDEMDELVDEMFGASWCELTQPDMMPDFDGIDDYEPQAPAPVVQEGDWITFNVPRPR